MHFVNQALVLKKFQLTLSRRLSCYPCYRENLGVIQPCFQKNTISPWHSNLNNLLSLGFMWRINHISNNAPFIPIYFASETWLLEEHPHFSTCKILQICSLWKWVPTYVVECQTVRQLTHNCIQPGGTANINVSEEGETAVIPANFLDPHGPLQLSRVTLLVSNTDTVQLPKGKRMEEARPCKAAKPSDCSGPGLAPPSQDTKSLTHSLYHVQGQLTTSCTGAWYCHGMVRNQCSLNKSPYLVSIRPSNSSTAPKKGAIRHKTVCCSKVGKYL